MFWDSSALVPLILPERGSSSLASLLRSDTRPTMWWATPVECLAAIHRRHREDPLPKNLLAQALQRLDALSQDLDTVVASDPVRRRTGRLLAVHALRAADSLQLAAALTWCEDRPEDERFVTLDQRLRGAASAEGFVAVPE